MRIGLISDTHIFKGEESLLDKIKEVFKDTDLILHAGDLYSPFVLKDLESIAPVLAARGDDDWIFDDERIKETHMLSFEGFAIWLTHEFFPLNSYSRGILSLNDTMEMIKKYGDLPDILIFGHSHRAFLIEIEGSLFINPGSATYPDYVETPGTVSILTISQGKAEVNVIQL